MWNNFLVGGIFGYFLRFTENKYPEETKSVKQRVYDFGIKLAYNSLYLYSGVQIWFTRIKNDYNARVVPLVKDFLKEKFNYEFGETNTNVNNDNAYYVEFIANGVQLSKHSFSFKNDNQGEILSIINANEPKVYDFFILNDNVGDKKNRVLYYEIPGNLFYNEHPPSHKFLSLDLEYNGETREVPLTSADYNFAIVGNRIDREFVMYFLKNVLNIPIPEDLHASNLVYNIHLIDSNVNVVNLDQTDELKFTTDGYIISKITEQPHE
jgi:hypothetical protein